MKEQYMQQLAEKVDRITDQFAAFIPASDELEVYQSPLEHFRQRAEFRLWHERDSDGVNTGEAYYAMFETPVDGVSKKKVLKRTDQLSIASEAINDLMPRLLQELQAQDILLERLFQVEFLGTLSGEVLVTLIYHKPLNEKWEAPAKILEQRLGIFVMGRSRKQKVIVSQDYVTEQLSVHGKTFTYKQIEGGFTQPNATVCQHMLEWSCSIAESIGNDRDLLELYCGNGNFTLPLSQHFRKVLATEVSKTSVRSARHNIITNGCDNIGIARLSAEEFTEAYQGVREFKRLQQDDIDVKSYDVSTIFVDPPRAGIDDDTLALMQNFEHIIYISCNPDTLFDNLQVLEKTHEVVTTALFDQFPYTHHVEMGVYLRKRR